MSSLIALRKPRMGRRVVFRSHEIADLEGFLCRGPAASEIAVKVLYTAISVGTESAVLLGLPNAVRTMPYYPGYSGCGVVVAKGRNVVDVQLGDLVAGQIGHSSFAIVKSHEIVVFESEHDSCKMAFSELGCIVQQAMRKACVQLGEHVAIVGTGLLSQFAAIYANHLGAGHITMIDRSGRAASAIAELPIEVAYVVTASASCQEIRSIGADVVIEAVGNASALLASVEAVRWGGRVVNLGSTRDAIDATRLVNLLVDKEASLIGAHISTTDRTEGSRDDWTHGQERDLYRRLVEAGTVQAPPYEIVHARRREDVNYLYEEMIWRRRRPGAILLAWPR